MRRFFYPKNLKASPLIWHWTAQDMVILGLLVFGAVVLGSLLQNLYPLCVPMVWAVLSIRIDDGTIWEALCYACRYFLTGQQKFYWNGGRNAVILSQNDRSTRQQLGIQSFSHYGLKTARGELLIYTISPTNISVLSDNATYGRVEEFARLLESLPSLEVSITDVSESFDSNKAFLMGRLRAEEDPRVRQLLEQDLAFLDTIQIEMATARIFMLMVRTSGRKETETFRVATETERIISANGFRCRRMRKSEIKRMLALYLDAGMEGDRLPDVDGEQYL